MRRRKFQIILIGCLLVIVGVLVLRPTDNRSDHDRYLQLLRTKDWRWRLNSAQKQLPGPLVRLFHIANLKKSCQENAQAQEEALLASGYLTNASITITNLSFAAVDEKRSMAEVSHRLRASLRGVNYSFYMESNQAVITCRTSDLILIRQAIESP
jgi:hypothetical protein